MRALFHIAALAATVFAASPASAMSRGEFVALVTPLAEIETNQRLEKEFSTLVETRNRAGIKALAQRVRASDGKALDEITALMKRVQAKQPGNAAAMLERLDGKSRTADSDDQLALTFSACHYAGMMIRTIVVRTAAGQLKPVFRKGTVMIDGNDLDSLFAQNMTRCEIIKHSGVERIKRRYVGSSCLITGAGCMDDPDFAAEDQKK